jgi:Tol biopolymer transport system component
MRPKAGARTLLVTTTRFDGRNELVTLDIQTKSFTRFLEAVDGYSPACSPNGQAIAYVDGGTGDIWVMNVDGTARRNLTRRGGKNYNPAWAPDNSQIAFIVADNSPWKLFVQRIDEDSPREISNISNCYDAVWVPDGRSLLCLTDGTLKLLDIAGGTSRPFVALKTRGWVYPCWSPGGKNAAFGGDVGDDTLQIFVANAAGTKVRQVTAGSQSHYGPRWSPDGRFIAAIRITGRPDAGKRGDLVLFDVVSETETLLESDMLLSGGSDIAWIYPARPAAE